MTPKCPDCKRDQDDCSCSETIESLRQQLADIRKQEPVAIYNGREGEYGYETITIFSEIMEGAELFTSACAMTKRDQACIDACANIPTYQLTGEDDKPTDLCATIESLRQQLADSQKREAVLRNALQRLWKERAIGWVSIDAWVASTEALAATEADLAGLILCEKEPVAWAGHEYCVGYKHADDDMPLYRAWEPK